VINDHKALEWVIASEKMAFRSSARVPAIGPGEPFAIYLTRGAYHNPTKDGSQIVALGRFASELIRGGVMVDGVQYQRSCRLVITATSEPRKGLPFPPLVDDLAFIRSKRAWATYLRRTLVPIDDSDFALIAREFERATSATSLS
jgi:hypothetical protein